MYFAIRSSGFICAAVRAHWCRGVLLAVFAGCLVSSRAWADETVSLETIRAAVREHTTSIRSISTKYRVWFTPAKGSPFKDGFLSLPNGPRPCEWAEQGTQKLIACQPFEAHGEVMAPLWVGHDGRTGYAVDFDRSDPPRIVRILETPTVHSLYTELRTPAEFAGLRLMLSDENLGDLLARPEARPDGVEEVGGVNCWRVDVGTYRARNGGFWHVKAAFDPTRGFLPRRVACRVSEKEPQWEEKAKDWGWQGEFEVTGFQRVRDSLSGADRWFPREGHYRNGVGDERFLIDEARINAEIPLERFQPRPEKGTEIVEGPTRPGEPVKSYIFGGPEAVDGIVGRRVDEAARLSIELTPDAGSLDARDPGPFFSARLLFWLSVGLIAAVACWHLASRMRSQ